VPPYGPEGQGVATRGGPGMEEQEQATLVEETLVEEVSIDGMCGVY
jgi:mycofactocin precursor